MGWFSKNDTTTNSFGAANNMQQQNMGGMQNADMYGMAAQNPMMQQLANDPVTATARLLELNDPVSQFIVGNNLPLLMDLVSEIVRLSLKDFFSNVTFVQGDDNKITLEAASLPASMATLSPENLSLTLTRLTSAAQNHLASNQQQRQMFLQAHKMGYMANQEPSGFFGNLVGGLLGQQVQAQGGMGNMAKMGGAALL